MFGNVIKHNTNHNNINENNNYDNYKKKKKKKKNSNNSNNNNKNSNNNNNNNKIYTAFTSCIVRDQEKIILRERILVYCRVTNDDVLRSSYGNDATFSVLLQLTRTLIPLHHLRL